MAKHEIVIHENTGATAAAAPYLGSYVSKETVRLAGFAGALAEKCGLPAIQVQAILSGCFDEIQNLERESLVRMHLDGFCVHAVITGSFPTADAAFDESRNALELVLRLDDALRLELADTVPSIAADGDLTRLRVDNLMDLAEERPMNLVHGRHVFRVAGFNMVLTDEGAGAWLVDARGTTFPLAVDEEVSRQLFRAHVETLLPGGDYKLVVKSRAGDAEGPLQTAFRRVKYLRVEDPVPADAPVVESGDTAGVAGLPGKWYIGNGHFVLTGRNLADATVRYAEAAHPEICGEASVVSASDTAVELDSLPGAGNDAGTFVLTVTTPKGSTEYAFERFISRAPTA
ncbi:MAG: hypothetical protein PUE68_03155 [Kiritimatiellae bacterium]|nr:hypothetical protein [Kiritimatiellia bacterium]